MENNHTLALYVAYYLARFDKIALTNLGYKNWDSSFSDVSVKLNVKKHSVRNMRDEFDPLFGHRAGWYQRPMSPSRTRVALALENLDEHEIKAIVEDVLSGKIQEDPESLINLLTIADQDTERDKIPSFILRGPTGKKAEQLFIEHHRAENAPFAGQLIDARDLGCGYDFEIKSELKRHLIEVKGLAGKNGGLLFTHREWETAKRERANYTVCLVTNINEAPEISFINDPFSKLNAKKYIIQTVQVQWSVSNIELQRLHD